MELHSILAFTLVAAIAIASPGPATLMAINNSLAYGPRYAVWSSVGNASGLFCLSAAAMLGLGALLASSEWLFNAVKVLGAGYLFYLGARQLFKKRARYSRRMCKPMAKPASHRVQSCTSRPS
nr:hypothetical protein GCM10020185_84920 [Pseudomonas brassicacearum subsp. brassicacearum]